MNQWLVQFFALPVFIVTVSCLPATCEVFAAHAKQETNKFPYVVSSKTDKSCTLADMAIAIEIPYTTKENKTSTKTLQVPRDATTEGSCLSTISQMNLTWKAGEDNVDNVIRFTLINDHVNFSVFSIDVNIYLNPKDFPDAKAKEWYNASSSDDLHLFAASVTNGIYQCNEIHSIKMQDADVKISSVSLIAFNTATDTSSRTVLSIVSSVDAVQLTAESCNKDEGKTFTYVLKDKQDRVCAFARMNVSINVSYTTKDGKTKIATVPVPTDARVVGKCTSVSSEIELIWTAKPKSQFALDKTENSLKLGFVKEQKYSYLSYAIANIYVDETFLDAAEQGKKLTMAPSVDDKLFVAPANNGLYSCTKETTLNASNGDITVSDILLVAFDAREKLPSKRVFDCAFAEGNFKYVLADEKTMVPCVLADMDININVFYEKADKSQANKTFTVSEGKVTGNCGIKRSELIISWPGTEANKTTNSIAFRIAKNSSLFFVYEIEASIYMDEKNFPDAVDGKSTHHGVTDMGLQLFAAPAQNGFYKCQSLTEQVKADDIDISISDVSFIAFNADENLNSRKVQPCSDQPRNDSTASTPELTPTSTVSPSNSSTTPEPDPSIKDYHYVVTDSKTDVACIVANMEISIKVSYKTKDNKTKENTLNVPTTATTNGECEETSSTMELSWPAGDPKDNPKYENEQNAVTFTFKKNESTYSLDAVGVTIYLKQKQFPDAAEEKYTATANNITAFSASLKNFYKCDPGTTMKVQEAGVTVSKVKLIAFNTEKSVASKSVPGPYKRDPNQENCVIDVEGADVGAIVGGIIGGIILIGIIVAAIMMCRKRRGGM